jgi:hypothetical protein
MITQMELECSVGHMTKYPVYAQNALDLFFEQIEQEGLTIAHIDCSRVGFIKYIAKCEEVK